jgi:hypothetical protein
VWIDEEEAKEILANSEMIAPFMRSGYEDPAIWFDGRQDEDPFTKSQKVLHSNVIPDEKHYGGTVCVFSRTDHKCALQVASEAAGQHPWHWKPFYCILHPLDLDEEGRITLDHTELLLDEPGSCLRPADNKIPLIETFEEELRYFLGDEEYEDLLRSVRLGKPPQSD